MPDQVHPSRDELRGVLLDEVSAERGLAIAGHLEGGCEDCALVMLGELGCLLSGPDACSESPDVPDSAAGPDRDALYDQAIDRALASSLRLARRTRRELARVPAAVAFLAERGSAAFLQETPLAFRGLTGVEALLARSRALLADDPAEAVRLAGAAVTRAGLLPPRHYGLRFIRDLECRAWVELGQAWRAIAEYEAARDALREAARRFRDGTGDEQLEAQLLDAQAVLRAESGWARISRHVYAVELDGDSVASHLTGRALVSRGIAAGQAGRSDEGVRLIGRGLTLLDPERDPALVLTAAHNLLLLLIALGRYGELPALVFAHRPAFKAAHRGAARPD